MATSQLPAGNFKLVRDNTGKVFLVNLDTMTRYSVASSLATLQAQLGAPVSDFMAMSPEHRWRQNELAAQYGAPLSAGISLDVRLGYKDGGSATALLGSQPGQPGQPGEEPEEEKPVDPANDPAKRSAMALVEQALGRYGLGSLARWAWDEIAVGSSYEEVLLRLRERPEFKQRFKAIGIREQNGLTPVDPETVLQYEEQMRELMRRSGLPSGFYDHHDDFAELIGKGVSPESVAQRVNEAWSRVVQAPEEVRQAFADIYGMKSDQALATLFFDPDKAESHLKKMASTAVAGGAMRAFGFGLDTTTAGKIAGFNFDDGAVRGGFAQLAKIRAVFNETLGEQGRDLDPLREGVNAVFDMGEGEALIDDRVSARRAEFSGGGSALATREGLIGLR